MMPHARGRAQSNAPRGHPERSVRRPGPGLTSGVRAISSAGERCLHTAEATGSKPVSPTLKAQVNGGLRIAARRAGAACTTPAERSVPRRTAEDIGSRGPVRLRDENGEAFRVEAERGQHREVATVAGDDQDRVFGRPGIGLRHHDGVDAGRRGLVEARPDRRSAQGSGDVAPPPGATGCDSLWTGPAPSPAGTPLASSHQSCASRPKDLPNSTAVELVDDRKIGRRHDEAGERHRAAARGGLRGAEVVAARNFDEDLLGDGAAVLKKRRHRERGARPLPGASSGADQRR